MCKLTKSLKNFLQDQKVSGNFVTKLHYYLQVCQIGGLYFEISIFFPAINMLEDWGIFHLKGGIPSSVLVQKHFCTLLGSLDISKSKWDIRFEKFQILDNLSVLKSDVLHWFAYISAPLCCTEMSLNLKHAWRCHL